MEQSRRGFLGLLLGSGAGVVAGTLPATATPQLEATTRTPVMPPAPPAVAEALPLDPRGKIRAALRKRLGDDIFSSWFHGLEFESY